MAKVVFDWARIGSIARAVVGIFIALLAAIAGGFIAGRIRSNRSGDNQSGGSDQSGQHQRGEAIKGLEDALAVLRRARNR